MLCREEKEGDQASCVRILHQAVWPDYARRKDRSSRFRCSIGGTYDCEYDRSRTTQGAEEGLFVR